MEALAAAEIPFLSKVEFLLFFRLFMLTFLQQYLFEVNVVGLSSREALASDEGSIFPSWPYQEYQIRIDCVVDGVLSRHQAYGLRSYCVLLLLFFGSTHQLFTVHKTKQRQTTISSAERESVLSALIVIADRELSFHFTSLLSLFALKYP